MLLAIDTSTTQIGLALYDGNRVLAESLFASGRHHTRELAPTVSRLLQGCDCKVADIQAVAVAIGPGSFTSLRVGLAFAKGLALARHLALIGIPTLDIVAASLPPTEARLAAVLQAGRGRLVVAWYKANPEGWQVESPPQVTTARELAAKIRKPVWVCGELTPDERQHLKRKFRNVLLASPAQCVRRPAILAEIAWKRWLAGSYDAAAALAPIYLHLAGGPLA